jgi:hypothetical protein
LHLLVAIDRRTSEFEQFLSNASLIIEFPFLGARERGATSTKFGRA